MCLRIPAALLAVAGLAACGKDTPVQPREPAVPTQTPAPQPPAVANPTPTPEPQPGNRPPTVTLTGGGACHPTVKAPCTVGFGVDAKDKDGDEITIEWTGCTRGHGLTEDCTIERPGEHTATVTVTDSRGARTRVSATARGTNQLPVVRIGGPKPPNPAPSNTFYPIAGGEPFDPDDYTEQNSACPHARVTATGPCRVSATVVCGGVGDVFDFDIRTLNGPGTCVVEATVVDPWGAVGRDTLEFRVAAP
jgi:hypothetical protein